MINNSGKEVLENLNDDHDGKDIKVVTVVIVMLHATNITQNSLVLNCSQMKCSVSHEVNSCRGNFIILLCTTIALHRRVPEDVIKRLKLHMMPGFEFYWKYNKPIEPLNQYGDESKTKEFVR